jgi:hypothetical protein
VRRNVVWNFITEPESVLILEHHFVLLMKLYKNDLVGFSLVQVLFSCLVKICFQTNKSEDAIKY